MCESEIEIESGQEKLEKLPLQRTKKEEEMKENSVYALLDTLISIDWHWKKMIDLYTDIDISIKFWSYALCGNSHISIWIVVFIQIIVMQTLSFILSPFPHRFQILI